MTVTQSTVTEADVIITAVEINDRHGVGILLQRIFKDRSQIFSIRTLDLYDGEQTFSKYDCLLNVIGLSPDEIFKKVQKSLSQHTIKRILCVPYHPEEIFAALAVQKLFGAEICTYLMDDQNVLTTGITDAIMGELLAKSSLRLAISPEMRDVYTVKYQVPIYFVPPVVPAALVNDHTSVAPPRAQMGAIFGNIWSPKWLEMLRMMTKDAGIQIDWYGNTGADWNFRDRQQLSNDGIVERGFLPTEAELVEVLRTYAYVVVPSGTLDSQDDNPATSWLSLPSRIPFVLATANTPIVVLGSSSTAAARFVTRFEIGTVADYEPVSFRSAVTYITQESVQMKMRENAAQIASQFVNEKMDEWIWRSLALGKPVDDQFEQLLTTKLDYISALAQSFSTVRECDALHQKELTELSNTIAELSNTIAELSNVITSMESTKFWKLRTKWLEIKSLLKKSSHSKIDAQTSA